MGLEAALHRFMLFDTRLARLRRLMREWKCAETSSHPEDPPPCWAAHSRRNHRNEGGPWIEIEYDPYPEVQPVAPLVRGLKRVTLSLRDDGGYETGVFLPDVSGYCPACRAKERLLILRRRWTPKRAGALRTLRAAYAKAKPYASA